MLVYVFLYVISILCLVYINNITTGRSRETKGRRASFFCFFCFAILLALRHQTMGIDLRTEESYGYLGMFETIAKSSWNEVFTGSFLNYEKGYVIYNKLLSKFQKTDRFC